MKGMKLGIGNRNNTKYQLLREVQRLFSNAVEVLSSAYEKMVISDSD